MAGGLVIHKNTYLITLWGDFVCVISYIIFRFYILLMLRKESTQQCCGCGMFIPDPNFFHPGSASKNLSIFFTQKIVLRSRKYDPGCSSRIRIPDPDPDFLTISDPGSRDQKGPGSRIRICNTAPQGPRPSLKSKTYLAAGAGELTT